MAQAAQLRKHEPHPVAGLAASRELAHGRRMRVLLRIDEAARVVPLERLCLSPQCGFSSTHHGNALSQDDQWRKLERVVEVAQEVWA
jgi:5-methyltetrahydropteroyltriglutamate--homocysteine methyltransferase